ncbi:pilus assembly protein [Sphingomonas donggukensis]|uniref:Pilus assembly protein n=1 Tax=Sphingomonas donggukensis TaxID=2949093 RepID=A0ABY4U2N1_9SPHN|nr:TadE/TadG family type IV pilus assembly protein [Sphingomonas donggukensis]URW76813.1 pilus assembly protein [Sphingomonas donggukensis]
MTAFTLSQALRRLRRDRRGATIVEFAIVAPVMCLMLLGAFDVSHTLYTRGVLQGIVQKTARDSSLEAGTAASQQAMLDGRVKKQVTALYNNADIDITRRFYRTFSDAAAAKAEAFSDTNDNGVCDANEPYEDANRNSVWDADGGNDGQGGAKDATLYTVTVTYPRMFPVYNLVGGSNTAVVSASTVLKNQPYADQASYGAAVVRNCP